ncbi:MAG: DNA polymerase III subunit delta [Gammaproteobacteria bacterium]|nr:DNA polymerase III subunit delta [Gammaproteobacteria bacterium]
MQLAPAQLEKSVQQRLAPVYLLTGDEPLQMMEAADAVRKAARAQAYLDREVFEAGRDFDWQHLLLAANSLSLFADRRVLDLRIQGSPGKAGSEALQEYTERLPNDTVLLVQCPKLDKRSQGAAWYKALDKVGVIVTIWPVASNRMPQWINERLQARGLQADREAVELLALRVEGNLLAAAQEIDKLVLLKSASAAQPVKVNVREVAEAVADSARFSVYDLVDAALEGKTAKTLRILNGLRAEGETPALVAWALANEIRGLTTMAMALAQGRPAASVFAAVWEKRKPLVQAALKRIRPEATGLKTWGILMRLAARADQVSKGAGWASSMANGNSALGLGSQQPWVVLTGLCLELCGPFGLEPALSSVVARQNRSPTTYR